MCSSDNEIRRSKLELSQFYEFLCLKQRAMLRLPWRICKIPENQQVLIVQPCFCTSSSRGVCSVAVSKISLDQPLQPLDADSLKICLLTFAPSFWFWERCSKHSAWKSCSAHLQNVLLEAYVNILDINILLSRQQKNMR